MTCSVLRAVLVAKCVVTTSCYLASMTQEVDSEPERED